MRASCPTCEGLDGYIETRNGQDCVFCANCSRWCYNAPKHETGRAIRPLRTRPDIKPNQRARILDRDNGTCILCHRANIDLDVGHLISIDEGRALGMTDLELYHDDNLAAMCGPCNSGYGAISVNPRLLVATIRARIQRRGDVA
jgi:hypothetical protein